VGAVIASDSRRVKGVLAGASALLVVAFSTGCGAESQIEPPESNKAEVAIRRHLADGYLYEKWYAQVGEIDVVGRRAFVSTVVGAGRRSFARQICAAVLSSGKVARVIVEFGPEKAQACP
jgi:hypothetical protein